MATYEYITTNGTILVDTAQIKSDVEAEFKEIYGQDISLDSSTDIGRQIDAEVTSRISVARNNAKLANQINPNSSDGVFLDANYALMGGQRDSAEQSTVDLLLTGIAGTIIPANSFVEDENNQLWFSVSQSEIGIDNTVTTSFRSSEFGPINADIGEINKIISGTLGWETVTNLSAAVPGTLEQSDISTRSQRRIELGQNARSVNYAIIAAVSALEGVNGVSFRENITDTSTTIDGIVLVPHSTWICVDGGVGSEIAEAYYTSKSGGVNFNGNQSESYTDPFSGQEYSVLFDRPVDYPVLVRVTAKFGASSGGVEGIKAAVLAYVNGEIDGEQGFYLAADVSPFAIGSAVNVSLSNVFVSKVEVAINSSSPIYTTNTLTTKINEKASITENDIEVILL